MRTWREWVLAGWDECELVPLLGMDDCKGDGVQHAVEVGDHDTKVGR